MARSIYRGYAVDGNGTILSSASVYVYLTGTSTAASIYTASSGGTAVNSVTTDSTGLYSFYVDPADYDPTTQFRLTISKTGYDSVTYDEVSCFNQGNITVSNTAFGSSWSGVSTVAPSQDAVYDQIYKKNTVGFSAYITSTVGNQTGDGTAYDLTGAIWTETNDLGACFSNGVFTTPTEGYYLITGTMFFLGLTSGHTNAVLTVYDATEGEEKSYVVLQVNPYAVSVTGQVQVSFSQILYLAASRLVNMRLQVSGGDKVVDISANSRFSAIRLT